MGYLANAPGFGSGSDQAILDRPGSESDQGKSFISPGPGSDQGNGGGSGSDQGKSFISPVNSTEHVHARRLDMFFYPENRPSWPNGHGYKVRRSENRRRNFEAERIF